MHANERPLPSGVMPTLDSTSPTAPTTQLLRLLTCGSVDDGKSTLIGRLLYDSRAVFADQIAALESASKRKGEMDLDLSLLTDGLRWEREQGITIDVAYRYFSTATRRFVLIDSPGHVQYTRNMATGASNADAAVVLVDARHGVQEQTLRHLFLAALLGVHTLIVAVNKMDLVGWDRAAFEAVPEALERVRGRLGFDGGNANAPELTYVPISALDGDNLVHASAKASWYTGPTILQLLEAAPARFGEAEGPARFPVQFVIRPRASQSAALHDYRGYAGSLASGRLRVGDRVMAMSSGKSSTIARLHLHEQELAEAHAPQSIAITLADDIDIGRGEMVVSAGDAEPPWAVREFAAMVVWMTATPMTLGRRYLLRHTTQFTPAVVAGVEGVLDVHTLTLGPAAKEPATLNANDIARVRVRTATPIFADAYRRCRGTGSFVLIDEGSGDTVALGLVEG